MKKLLAPLIISCLFIVTACSSGNEPAASSDLEKKVSELESTIAKLTEENAKLKEGAAPITSKATSTNATEGATPTPKEEPELTIKKGAPITIEDFAEVEITKTKFAKTVNPSSPGSFYTYYEAKGDGTTYLAITAKIKNLLESAKEVDDLVTVKIKYDGKYEYSSFSTIEAGDGSDFNYTSLYPIDPLSTGTAIFLSEVPKEVETSDKSVVAEISINGETYLYTIR
ncbi:hypothetical protein J41TS12_41360 [Paenibacillus antibioticophila]|uniref:Lipoprotein n=1 Tax=Paenibacillus antibioticophila TaxID=1274374 RepID=A0A919XZL2_9BACL|nr:bZIP transcription factor [Paenibacillus antibioticophila]GIO39275.1 hypothetical protein J41TS12_41360 [Paenibacillus antibioticophila]